MPQDPATLKSFGYSGFLVTALLSSLSYFNVDTYRLTTRFNALQSLFLLNQTEIDRFMASYALFDGDWSNDNGKSEAQIVDYYNVLNHLCALGNVEKMYIPPFMDGNVNLAANQELFELKMMEDVGLTPDGNQDDKKVLELGCGRGRISAHTARETGAFVYGMNIDPSQIANAQSYAEHTGLGNRTDFRVQSFNDMPFPFPDEYFDASYQVQAFSYALDKEALFKEIYRVLKPGAKFSYLDWVLLDNYEEGNKEHEKAIRHLTPLLGAVDTVHYKEVEDAIKKAGFKILLSEEASRGEKGIQGPLIQSERETFAWLGTFSKYFLPKRFTMMLERMDEGVQTFIDVDAMRLGTTSYQIVIEKPGAHCDA